MNSFTLYILDLLILLGLQLFTYAPNFIVIIIAYNQEKILVTVRLETPDLTSSDKCGDCSGFCTQLAIC